MYTYFMLLQKLINWWINFWNKFERTNYRIFEFLHNIKYFTILIIVVEKYKFSNKYSSVRRNKERERGVVVHDRWFKPIAVENQSIFIDIRKGVFDILKFLRLVKPYGLIGLVCARQPFPIYVRATCQLTAY